MINPNIYKDPATYKAFEMSVYKQIFAESIKQNFLISMIDAVEEDKEFIGLFMNKMPEYFSAVSTITGNSYSRLTLCKMIIMVHYKNTFHLDPSERGKLQNSPAYKQSMVREITKMYKVEDLTIPDTSNISFESFLPLIYYVSAFNNFVADKYSELYHTNAKANPNYNLDFNLLMISKIVMKIRACISLADIRAIDELTVTFRSLIETFMIYAALWDKDINAINAYYKNDQLTFDYSRTGIIPEEVIKEARKTKVPKVDMLNYGWLKELNEFINLSNDLKIFNLRGLANVLDVKYGSTEYSYGSELYKVYKSCNPQAHSTTLRMHYLQLEMSVFQNIAVMLKFVANNMATKLYSFDFKYHGLDLLEEVNNYLNESTKTYNKIYNDISLLERTDKEYVDRNECIRKLKFS